MTPPDQYRALVRLYDRCIWRAQGIRKQLRRGYKYAHRRQQAEGRLKVYETVIRELKEVVG